MRQYNKSAFFAGFKAAYATRGWPKSIRGVKQLLMDGPYNLVWHDDYNFTLSWTFRSGNHALILDPTISDAVITGSGVSGSSGPFQWGVCTEDGTMPSVIGTGANRISYTNGLPNGANIIIDDPTNGDCIFVGQLYPVVGQDYSITIGLGARIITEAGDPIITESGDYIIRT